MTLDTRGTLPVGIPLQISGHAWLSPAAEWLGVLTVERPLVTGEGDFIGGLVLAITDEQLAVIEARRVGSDLQLRVDVAIVLGYDAPPLDEANGLANDLRPLGTWPLMSFETDLHVQSGTWERLLEQSAAGTSLAIVVPVPIGRDAPATRAGEKLRDAIQKINDGDYEDAVTSARKAIDALAGEWPPEKSITAIEGRKRTYDQRRALLRHALYSLSSPAAHGDLQADAIKWDRPNALSVVAGVAALVACGQPGTAT